MKVLMVMLVTLLIAMQYRLWWGDGNIMEVASLANEVSIQQQDMDALLARNELLAAEVHDLKHRLGAIEERARMDLGMIREGEVFYQVPVREEDTVQ